MYCELFWVVVINVVVVSSLWSVSTLCTVPRLLLAGICFFIVTSFSCSSLKKKVSLVVGVINFASLASQVKIRKKFSQPGVF